MVSNEGPVVNLFSKGDYKVKLGDGSEVEMKQETSYPEDGIVQIIVKSDNRKQFALRIRIPTWSKNTTLKVNHEKVECAQGRYAVINRVWNPLDSIILTLDMRGRIIDAPSGAPAIAIMRGPLLLSIDDRMVKPDNTVLEIVRNDDGTVTLTPLSEKPDGIWMAFSVPFAFYRWPNAPAILKSVTFCDYQSAGNQFSSHNAFRSWLPQPFNMLAPFPYDTWKLTYEQMRPLLPPDNKVSY